MLFSIFQIPFKLHKLNKSGIATAFDNHWKFLRSTLSPTFTSGKMKLVCLFFLIIFISTIFFTIKILHRSLSVFRHVSLASVLMFVLDHYHVDNWTISQSYQASIPIQNLFQDPCKSCLYNGLKQIFINEMIVFLTWLIKPCMSQTYLDIFARSLQMLPKIQRCCTDLAENLRLQSENGKPVDMKE